MQTLELLAPAKDIMCGKAAIDHGADAVYIGAPNFGARVAAGNSLEDISELCRYAHQFSAKVYVTVNTLIYDSEVESVRILLRQLSEIGVDAVLVQDMAVLYLNENANDNDNDNANANDDENDDEVPIQGIKRLSLTLHASTQTDNRTAEKVAWLRSLGFTRVVLARELSLEEIRHIHERVPDVELEVFVHGALCVSYSGLCYASERCFGRSANRGACAQFCRMKFDLIDADGREIEHQRHLLSLKDLCQIDRLEELAAAGACSFKIEGRLKDVGYVKNVVSAYSQRLDEVIRRNPDKYVRASKGRVEYYFEPNLKKTFNRGQTHYFLDGRRQDIASFDTPKAIGEYVGRVKEIRGRSFTVAGTAAFANGDGLCFINSRRELDGFRVNRAEAGRLFPLNMPQELKKGMPLYRNNDVAFEKILSGKTAERYIPVTLTLTAIDGGFSLRADGDGFSTTATIRCPHQLAERPQHENIIRQLTRLGNTIYRCEKVNIEGGADSYFIPSSQLAELRRKTMTKNDDEGTMNDNEGTMNDSEKTKNDNANANDDGNSRKSLSEVLIDAAPRGGYKTSKALRESATANDNSTLYTLRSTLKLPLRGIRGLYAYSSLYNISNSLSETFYAARGVKRESDDGAPLMQCRHCLRYALGYCVKHGGRRPTWREPLRLRLGDGREFRLQFDCKECQMNIFG